MSTQLLATNIMSARSEPLERRSSRLRTLTSPARDQYERNVNKHCDRLRDIKTDIDSSVKSIDQFQDKNSLESLREFLDSCITAYEKSFKQLMDYLQTVRTTESKNEQVSQDYIQKAVRSKVAAAHARITALMKEDDDKSFTSPSSKRSSSHSSRRSSRSSRTGSSSALQRMEAKLAASRVRLKFIAQETDILKEKAALEGRLKLTKAECDVEMREKEVQAMRYSPSATSVLDDMLSHQSSQERTRDYVASLGNISDKGSLPNDHASEQDVKSTGITDSQEQTKSRLSPHAPPFTPNDVSQIKNTSTQSDTHIDVSTAITEQMTTFTRFLIKKDLLMSRLVKYDDDPMSYLSWKLSFKAILRELHTEPSEELDLLVRFLGPMSAKQATTIRSCNAHDPVLATQKIWERLEERFGSPEMVVSSLKQRIASFPKIANSDSKRLFDLVDMVNEISSVKQQPQFSVLFAYFDSSTGVNAIVSKLPWNIQDKWTVEASKYKRLHEKTYPPFSFFVKFLQDTAVMKNDPSFQFDRLEKASPRQNPNRNVSSVAVKKTETISDVSSVKTEATSKVPVVKSETNANVPSAGDTELCPMHKTKHLLNECKAFRRKSIEDRKAFVRSSGICFKCCGPKKHRALNCKTQVKCDICNATSHPTAFHIDAEQHVGETLETACTQICGKPGGTSKSCAKIVPVSVHHEDYPQKSRIVYALIDDQSTHSLASSSFFDFFRESGPEYEYKLTSCAGKTLAFGRRGVGYTVESLDHTRSFQLPPLIECNDIPNNREEIPSPEVARQYQHLEGVASNIPSLIQGASIDLLIGRDLTPAHHVQEQITNPDNNTLPFAQRLPLGWVIIGPVCHDALHMPNDVTVNKTFVLNNGRTSLFQPCDSQIIIKDNIFVKTDHDEKTALSVDDKTFLDIMNASFHKDASGHWVAELPFRTNRRSLPNNKAQATTRALSLDRNLRRDPVKKQHVFEFMDKVFDRGHAEIAPVIPDSRERWYLPMFGVYHPKKRDSIRMVFDSSARFNGTSLNDVLLKGPDISNSLQGILLRFRREQVAITGDVEQMFHNFKVQEDHRDFLRFLWHPANDLDQPLQEYRMTVHVFGNRPSPSVATYGLRRSVLNADPDVMDFVSNNFYVDDGLMSCVSEDAAVSLMKRTQIALKEGGELRLHKIASNSKSVLLQFPKDDLTKELKSLEIGEDDLPMQRSLGLSWDINADNFMFKVAVDTKPFTRRGVLSIINSLFDPIGFTGPVTLQGKLLLREMMSTSENTGWDDPLDDSFRLRWITWVESLCFLKDFRIPRMICKFSVENSSRVEVHVFADASKDAIASVAYLKVFSDDGTSDVGFLLGKAKVAPSSGHTIPRLELCAAVLAVEIAEIIKEEMGFSKDEFYFYTDSRVILGYIANTTRRFFVYVANRISRIHAFSSADRWKHIPTDQNPADHATRSLHAKDLPGSRWILGPMFLHEDGQPDPAVDDRDYPLVDEDSDKEVRPVIGCAKVSLVPRFELGSDRFIRFSSWDSLVRAIAFLKRFARRWKSSSVDNDLGTRSSVTSDAVGLIIRSAQSEAYSEEIEAIQNNNSPLKNSSLLPLNPMLDMEGFLRIGGRLRRMKGEVEDIRSVSHPIIIPKKHHVAILLVRHFHAKVHHQGRNITEGAIRTGGYWIIGGKRTISSVIQSCVTCRKLRGRLGWTFMSDLPEDRIAQSPPFTFVGVDVFGPWSVVVRRTRGGSANCKRWGLLFTCLVSRAIHIELLEELSTSSFINALRRFVALRGPVKHFRSDRGTNFVGAVKELNIDAEFVETGPVSNYLNDNGIAWYFNPPYASHFGGVWERMIGSCRRILDALLLENKSLDLTHEVLSTFMAEVCAIVNGRPLVPVSSDPEVPDVLSPSVLLTQKQFVTNYQIPEMGMKDALRSQWKRVQYMADKFWSRWRIEYLNYLQTRSKWKTDGVVFKEGDVVLVKQDDSRRNEWPLGLIKRVFPSDDSKVRKVQVSVVDGNMRTSYVRPISRLVKLVEVD